ncbi:hypothetical protein N656DRAFT_601471 [Canariomyces notabilis]|uniref:Uncharacterized protein n=1 Tax=Canariomyces notabilis TaxID=2074819 RepID=A0AAN6YTT3_9PEZI|nr:hypothetical protein N656DRAFT_601471 [Canariomyces arenarius]
MQELESLHSPRATVHTYNNTVLGQHRATCVGCSTGPAHEIGLSKLSLKLNCHGKVGERRTRRKTPTSRSKHSSPDTPVSKLPFACPRYPDTAIKPPRQQLENTWNTEATPPHHRHSWFCVLLDSAHTHNSKHCPALPRHQDLHLPLHVVTGNNIIGGHWGQLLEQSTNSPLV